jgi:hypothetical protein
LGSGRLVEELVRGGHLRCAKEALDIMLKKLQTISGPDYNNVMHRFLARAQAIPYYVNFCSLTGEYCVDQVEENCG